MLFNSIDFAVFLPIVFFIYWFVFNRSIKWQNLFLVVASYIFYGWWDVEFLILIFVSTLTDYYAGLKMGSYAEDKIRKYFLYLSIITNLGILGYFKYSNFFIENFNSAFTLFGTSFNLSSLNIILPVGISFYTFQTLSYSIDVYKKKIEPSKDFIAFAAYVSFFPQLVAGPIERAKNFLPQFLNERKFDYESAVDGMRQILWGFFKKLVIADNCAVYVNYIFENHSDLSGSTLFLGGVFFIFQIYGDFSGYSDIAIGTSRLFGFKLLQNFNFPLFSRDIPEFWRRWHISLTTWLRDYVYIPLVKRGGGKLSRARNVIILFLLTGFWHGANWTFIVWGLLNALYFLPFVLSKKIKSHTGTVAEFSKFPSIKEVLNIMLTFFLALIGIIFFRAENIDIAFDYILGMWDYTLFEIPYYRGIGYARPLIILIIIFLIIEWIGRKYNFALEILKNIEKGWIRKFIYSLIILVIGIYMYTGTNNFIYFQF
ncbi:MBOAT family O-acyltransferase [Salinimicrobium flavum]|uniref:MBOAT family O-acyltransferase n=1 Tax=Salinimicrobium flavum TaxID=1737065 RepID=A0ABW5IYN5_9FLAO